MSIENCSVAADALCSLIEEIKLGYEAPEKVVKRGRKLTFSERSFLLIAVVTRTFSDAELHRLLSKDGVRLTALELPRVPHRTRILRRLKTLVPLAEAQIAHCGKTLLQATDNPEEQPQMSATDGCMDQAVGPKWHATDRQKERLPAGLRKVDVESSWSKSNYRGWVQGYQIVLPTLVFPAPVPLFAVWRENAANEAKIAVEELAKGRLQVTEVMLGDTAFGKEDFGPVYQKAGGYVLTPRQLPPQRRSWQHDLYAYRRESIELLFQRLMQAFDLKACQVLGQAKTGAFVLASVWAYHLCWLKQYRQHKNPALIKELIENARFRLRL